MTDVIDMEQATAAGAEVASGARESLEVVEALSIPGDITYREAVVVIAEIKEQLKAVLERREAIVRPLKTALAEVNALFKPATDQLEAAETYMKAKVLEARVRLHESADALMQEASASGDHRLVAKADEMRPPDLAGVSLQTVWGGEVVDEDKIPRKYMMPNLKKLTADTKAASGAVTIEGWRPQRTERMAITTEKIERIA